MARLIAIIKSRVMIAAACKSELTEIWPGKNTEKNLSKTV